MAVKHSAPAARAKTHSANKMDLARIHTAFLKDFRSACLCSLVVPSGLGVIRKLCLYVFFLLSFCRCLILMFCMVCSHTAVQGCSVQTALFKQKEKRGVFKAHLKVESLFGYPQLQLLRWSLRWADPHRNHAQRKPQWLKWKLCSLAQWSLLVPSTTWLRVPQISPDFWNEQTSKNLPHRKSRFFTLGRVACESSRSGFE